MKDRELKRYRVLQGMALHFVEERGYSALDEWVDCWKETIYGNMAVDIANELRSKERRPR